MGGKLLLLHLALVLVCNMSIAQSKNTCEQPKTEEEDLFSIFEEKTSKCQAETANNTILQHLQEAKKNLELKKLESQNLVKKNGKYYKKRAATVNVDNLSKEIELLASDDSQCGLNYHVKRKRTESKNIFSYLNKFYNKRTQTKLVSSK